MKHITNSLVAAFVATVVLSLFMIMKKIMGVVLGCRKSLFLGNISPPSLWILNNFKNTLELIEKI